jgi:hypothetical protein
MYNRKIIVYAPGAGLPEDAVDEKQPASLSEPPFFSIRAGQRELIGVLDQWQRVVFNLECRIYLDAAVEVAISRAQAEDLAKGLPADVVLSDLPIQLRRIFSSGFTPAEFDDRYALGALPMEEYPGYRSVVVRNSSRQMKRLNGRGFRDTEAA